MHREFAGTSIACLKGKRADIIIPTPVAGKDWAYTFESGYMTRLLAVYWELKASAQVATRTPQLVVVDGDKAKRILLTGSLTVTAGQLVKYSFARGVTAVTNGGAAAATYPLPDMLFDAGWQLQSSTFAIQTEDENLSIRLLIEQLWDPYPGEAAGFSYHDDSHDAYPGGHHA